MPSKCWIYKWVGNIVLTANNFSPVLKWLMWWPLSIITMAHHYTFDRLDLLFVCLFVFNNKSIDRAFLFFICYISRRLLLPVFSGTHLHSVLDELLDGGYTIPCYRKSSFMPHFTHWSSLKVESHSACTCLPLCWPVSAEPWIHCRSQTSLLCR